MASRNVSDQALIGFLVRSDGDEFAYRLAFDLLAERDRVQVLETALRYVIECPNSDDLDPDYLKRILDGGTE